MKKRYLLGLLAAGMMIACGSDNKSNEADSLTILQPEFMSPVGPYKSLPVDVMDSIPGHGTIRYRITGTPDESLAQITERDMDGMETGCVYIDNRYELSVYRRDSAYFRKALTKEDFRTRLLDEIQENAILDGMCYDRYQEGVLHFRVSFTDVSCSESHQNFFYSVYPDGSSVISPDTIQDVTGMEYGD